MTNKSFAELTRQVHILNDLILSDMICGSVDYTEEFLAFSHHLFATKYWFVRISWPNKRRYILALMEDVRSTWALSLLLKSLWNCRPKDAVLSANEPKPWSIYDQVPLDHNRTAMPTSTLGQVMTNDRKWFHLLEPEAQALVLSELLTIAGGPLLWEVLRRGQTIYERQRDQQLRDLLDCIVVDQNLKTEKVTIEPPPPPEQKKDKKNEVTLISSDEDMSFSSNPPGTPNAQSQAAELANAQKNLVASLAAWNTIIKGIQNNQKLEELEMTFKDGSVRKIWKVNRVKPEAIETVDFLQLLPSAIGKRILCFLPKNNLPDYAKVNKYWSFLVEELKVEQLTRTKFDQDRQKLEDLMLKNDISMETLAPSNGIPLAGSIGPSIDPSSQKAAPSYRPSEQRSAGGVSFRHMVVERLKPAIKIKPKPITRLADLNDRLERRGAADENLWQWCENSLKHLKGRHPKGKTVEGVLMCDGAHFPCPLMKHSVELPLSVPLSVDPACPTAGLHKTPRRNFSYPAVNLPHQDNVKRFSLWSRDFSSLYKVFKVASYQSPV